MPNLKNALLNWLNNSIAHLSTRTPYAKGYREGITQAKAIVENIINDAEPTDFYLVSIVVSKPEDVYAINSAWSNINIARKTMDDEITKLLADFSASEDLLTHDNTSTSFYNEDGHGFCASIEKHSIIEKNYQICSYCGKRFNEGYFLGNEYACSHECAVGLYKGDEKQLNADLEQEELEPGTTECYWTIWD